jgi:hypothetical protein
MCEVDTTIIVTNAISLVGESDNCQKCYNLFYEESFKDNMVFKRRNAKLGLRPPGWPWANSHGIREHEKRRRSK